MVIIQRKIITLLNTATKATNLAVSKSFKNGFKTGDSHKLQRMLSDALFLSVVSTDDAKLPRGDIEPKKC